MSSPIQSTIGSSDGQNLPRTIRILALDGGGVRGYSTLLMLEEILKRADQKLNGNDASSERSTPKVSDFFDIVVGTSTGGLIALMLVKLDMSVEACITKYEELANQIFGHKRSLIRRIFGSDQSTYSGGRLLEFVTRLIEEHDQNATYRMQDSHPNPAIHCSVVCRQRQSNWRRTLLDQEVFLCSDPGSSCHDCEMAQAARATSAAPLYFGSIYINGMDLVDGAYTRTNNPSKVTWQHYKDFHKIGDDDKVMIVNLGTGTRPKEAVGVPGPKQPWWTRLLPDSFLYYYDMIQDLVRLAVNCEDVASEMAYIAKQVGNGKLSFSRFSADTGIHAVKLDDFAAVTDKSENGLKYRTIEYIRKTDAQFDQLAQSLADDYRSRRNARSEASTHVTTMSSLLANGTTAQRTLSVATPSVNAHDDYPNLPDLLSPSVPTESRAAMSCPPTPTNPQAQFEHPSDPTSSILGPDAVAPALAQFQDHAEVGGQFDTPLDLEYPEQPLPKSPQTTPLPQAPAPISRPTLVPAFSRFSFRTQTSLAPSNRVESFPLRDTPKLRERLPFKKP